ncbi:unnamed protein product [Nezara viridula]|uniref:Uncharacterized protein n=1 Tax=Nezara viridula TaxID=85310 RepID=A0A9P0H489_NEZVI|nr:unnamed protein product [Nezara viridula]
MRHKLDDIVSFNPPTPYVSRNVSKDAGGGQPESDAERPFLIWRGLPLSRKNSRLRHTSAVSFGGQRLIQTLTININNCVYH